ncbi:MAG: isoamylase early set domain-containing protein [Melioribacteraceae bacterium]|nr:isoamylase early set domain-containing protein [Melioribacteraceae bacterium]
MSITKTILKSNKSKVIFKISAEAAKDFANASLVGDFNNWDASKDQMKKLKKDGSFSIQKTFESGKEYQFKYLLDAENWINEPEQDGVVETEFADSQNSVVML